MANYLTLASAEPFTIAVSNATKNWDGTLCYSTDSATWNEWDGAAAIASAEHGGEHRIYMRGSGNSRIMPVSSSFTKYNLILTGSEIRCIGNIENLLDYETVANGDHPVMANSCYMRMFYGCTSLVTAPDLPAIALSGSCYESMFEQCANLTQAPALPASTVNERCYYRMFSNCGSLVSVPKLSATELPKECYMRMFYGCTSIKLSEAQSDEYHNEYRIPASGAGTVTGVTPTYQMFSGTGGTFTGNPTINTTYYTANEVIYPPEPSVPFEPDPFSVTLGWLVGSRIAGQRGEKPIVDPVVLLLSADDYILKDSNGLYITAKEVT